MGIWSKLLKRFTAKPADLHHWHAIYDWLTTTSGERVTPATAMGVAAYFACVRNIGEDVAKLPLDTFRKVGQRREPVDTALDYLMNVEANPEMSAMAFRETLTAHAAGIGNGYAQIEWNGRVEPTAFWPIDPTTVTPKREAGQFYYEVMVNGVPHVVMPGDMLHIHGIGGDGTGGYNVLHLAREALGAIIASQKFAAAFFGNGATLGSILQHPAKLSDKALQHLRDTWIARHGGAANAMKPAILEEGMTYQQLGVPPEQAQFLETRQFGVEEVCRWFRMPPHKVQHLLRATFSNIEEQNLEYADTLAPWAIRWEQELKRKCLSVYTQKNVYVRLNFNSLLRTDVTKRQAFYASMIQNGVMNIDEVRALEDLNPVPGGAGAKHYHQMNMVELGKEKDFNKPAPAPKPTQEPDADNGDAADESDDTGNDQGERMHWTDAFDKVRALDAAARVLTGHRAALVDAYARVLRVEADKAVRAQKRGDLDTWADGFYVTHEAHVEDVLSPLIEGIAAGFGPVDMAAVTEHAARLAGRHVIHSYEDMARGAVDEWTRSRPASAADEALEYLKGAYHAAAET